MELTQKERDFLRPYLAMDVSRGGGWMVGAVAGALVCAGALVAHLTGLWPEAGPYLFLALVVGMVVIEVSLNRRDKLFVARILQKYTAKLDALRDIASARALPLSASLAVGDGANDAAMLAAAGLGVGYRPKAPARDAANVAIDHGDLTALLYLQGYRQDDFVG